MRIELRGVGKRYGKVVALDAIDLDIPSGARVALLGANGSGKTTLTRVIMGLVSHEGRLKLGDRPAVPRPPALTARIAYVPQIAPPWTAPVGDVVATIAALRDLSVARFHQHAALVGLDLAGLLHRPFRDLSGGTKKKLLIALALAAPASLYVFDEPSAGLDAAARRRFFDIARDAWGDSTVLLCSHRLDELRTVIDHVVLLADGHLAWSGPAERYLAEHLTSTVEIRVADGEKAWLHDHGFVDVAGGWWRRSVDATEKLTLVPAALSALGGRVRDLAIHDAEKVDA